MGNWLFHFLASYKAGKSNFLCHFYGIHDLLIALVTYGGPTPSNYYMHDVGTPKGHLGGIHGRRMVRPGIPQLSDFSCPKFLLL